MKVKLKKLPEVPLVSFIILAYNHQNYIRMAVDAALSQEYEKLEIIIFDDNSTDATYEIITAAICQYNGPHKIKVFQNNENLGLTQNLNKAISVSNGDIIVISAGDDISLSNRVISTVKCFNNFQNASAVLLSAYTIDVSGKRIGEIKLIDSNVIEKEQVLKDLLKWKYVTFGATRDIRREVYSIFGNLRSDCPTEDTPLLIRSLLIGTNVITNNIGVLYRKHDKNLGRPESLSKMDSKLIYQQYSDDLHVLVSAGYVQYDTIRLFNNWSREDMFARSFRLKIIMEKNISLLDYLRALKCNAMSLNEKLNYLANIISSKIYR